MPEGHVLHRAARLHGKRFNGQRIEAESPQGRFASGAEAVDGATVSNVTAVGKHLFYHFDNDLSIHIHLGLYGKFRLQTPPFPDPSPNARLLLSTDDHRMHLAGPTRCDLVDDDQVEQVAARLGPDPILRPADGADQLGRALARRSVAIAAALLDQRAIAGLGNVYRAELLFMLGINPFTSARDISADNVTALWTLAVDELDAGERSGRIVTVDPSEVGARRRSDLGRAERLYVYKRHGKACRRCPDLIRSADLNSRTVWWCPTCQK